MLPRVQCLLLCLFLICRPATAQDSAESLRLTLPKEMYAVVGQEMNLYFDNVVLTETPEKCQFSVTCDMGSQQARRWSVTPAAGDVGEHSLSLRVLPPAGTSPATASTRLHVVAADAGQNKAIRLLIVGDSLTHASLYPNELARLLSMPGNPSWTMLGSHRPAGAAERVAHEGYGGWTWQRFASHFEPEPDGTYRKQSSPFVFLDASGKPALNVPRYFEETCGGERPDYVFFLLGINDCFAANPDDPVAMDQRIDAMFQQADTLLAAFRQAVPNAELAICLTTPPNARESGFEANYKGKYHRWGWKRIQHRLVDRLLERYSGREAEQLFIVPTELNLDPVDGYPEDNGVHPSAFGYRQIGGSLYAWLKSRLAAG